MPTKPRVPGGVKVLTIDIETAPIEAFTWGIWDQNIGLNQIAKDWSILSFAAKWLGDKKVIYEDTSKSPRDDTKLLASLWKLLNEADVVVTQNGKAFDVKKINARLLEQGFGPYSPIRHVDTKIVAKRHFAFTSNKLEWLSAVSGAPKKSSHKAFPGFALWSECLKGNPRAWAEMRKYNIRDVVATEALYLKLRPWIEGHPNVAVYAEDAADGRPACPKCGSKKMTRQGLRRTQTGEYTRYQCQSCAGWANGKTVVKRRVGLVGN